VLVLRIGEDADWLPEQAYGIVFRRNAWSELIDFRRVETSAAHATGYHKRLGEQTKL
jgi:hypothetical protein